MTNSDDDPGAAFGLVLDSDDQRTLIEIGDRLRREGWADFVTADHLMSSWRRLADRVSDYTGTIDDYTNDLCSRDGLALVLDRSPMHLSTELAARLIYWDDRSAASTDPDPHGLIGRYFRLGDRPGWWWRRIQRQGPLADYLAKEPS